MNWKNSGALFLIISFVFVSCRNNSQPKVEHLEYASTKSLIEAENLAQHLDNYVLIDLRKPEEYHQGHIPSALNVWRNQITDTSYAYRGMMPTQGQLESLLSQLGIHPNDTIVIYDDKAECDAARLWWILKFYGHDNIKLLNGGLSSWISSGGKLAADSMSVSYTEYRFMVQKDSAIFAHIKEVLAVQTDTQSVLLDTRGLQEYSGELKKKGAARAGKISNAANIDWAAAVNYDGDKKFRSAQELDKLYRSVGIDGKKPVVVYCHSGVRSAHTLFVLTELLGYDNIKNYDGSWTEWSHLRTD